MGWDSYRCWAWWKATRWSSVFSVVYGLTEGNAGELIGLRRLSTQEIKKIGRREHTSPANRMQVAVRGCSGRAGRERMLCEFSALFQGLDKGPEILVLFELQDGIVFGGVGEMLAGDSVGFAVEGLLEVELGIGGFAFFGVGAS
jgi:hypothetical protein